VHKGINNTSTKHKKGVFNEETWIPAGVYPAPGCGSGMIILNRFLDFTALRSG